MKLRSKILCLTVLAATMVSCGDDDDGTNIVIEPPRDRAEVDAEDQAELQAYFETHTYNYEDFENPSEDFDYVIRFDTIAGANANRIPLSERPELVTKNVTFRDFDYRFFILKIREGVGDAPTFADSTLVEFRGERLDNQIFDSASQPTWFDLPGTRTSPGIVTGLVEGLVEFKEASGFTVNPDNTIEFNQDYGIGAVFLPSGLAFFNTTISGTDIELYDPIIFSFQLFVTNQADHDRDGIPSFFEDLNGNGILRNFDDDTNMNGFGNYEDFNDDGDDELTSAEIEVEDFNGDGKITLDEITFTDTNGDGTPDYLQVEDGRPEIDNQ